MTNENNNNADDCSGNFFKRWFFQDTMDMESNFRNNMLVVATLIVAVTFQTGISPPGGVWQENKEGPNGHEAGKAILATLRFPFNFFLVLNTLAFSMSTQLLLVLLYHKTLYFEAVVATLAMAATYVTAVWSLSPDKDVKFRYVCMAALFPYLWRLLHHTSKTLTSSSRSRSP